MDLNTIALELLPNLEVQGAGNRRLARWCSTSCTGLDGRIRHTMLGMVAEDDDSLIRCSRCWMYLISGRSSNRSWRESSGLCTQVTAFMDEPSLHRRLVDLVRCRHGVPYSSYRALR